MPPQSRGNVDDDPDSFTGSKGLPHDLKAYDNDDDLSNTPIAIPPPESTPKFSDISTEDDSVTPVRPRFAVNEEDEQSQEHSEDEDEGNSENEQDYSLDDDEFESHYSRQDSPISTENDDEDEDEDEDGDAEDEDTVEMSPTRNRISHESIQRVTSLPSSITGSSHTSHLHLSHSTTSLPRAAPPVPPPLYPPFYNRPPTPLPPSPSLTSLLRPPSLLTRSATSTRPPSPDSSDIETPATNEDTEAAVASSARRAHPLPPTAPKVPTYEYYGFVLYLASTLAFFLYLLWAYLPSPFLHALGITYYPNRWWALAAPSWIVMLLIYIYVALACWNTEYLTLGLERVETMVDEAGSVAILDEQGRLRKGGSKRYETELEEKRKREKTIAGWSKKKTAGSGRKKERRRKDRDRDREDGYRFGYMGDVINGRVVNGLTWEQVWNEGTDAVMDVPIGGVCEVLYGDLDDL